MASLLTMSRAERERFLADVHVGVLAVTAAGGPPMATPVWYDYRPGGDVVIMTEPDSVKAGLLRIAGEATLCVQREATPPAYVTVSGPVTLGETTPDERQLIAARYLGEDAAAVYLGSMPTTDSLRVAIRPQAWHTADFAKLPAIEG